MKQWLFEQNTETLISLCIAVIIGLLAIYLLTTVIRYAIYKQKIENKISGLGVKQLKDITIDDGMDGEVRIERVLLTKKGIMALSTHFLTGNIFGDDRIDTWAQVIDKRTYRFPNPLYNFEYTLAALKHHFHDLNVDGKILFIGECDFPTGQPAAALLINDLEKHQQKISADEIDGNTMELWNKFEQSCKQIRDRKVALPGDKHQKQRLLISLFLLLISTGWLLFIFNQQIN